MTVSDAYKAFMYEQRFRNNSAETLVYYANALGMFIDFVGVDEPVESLDIRVYKHFVIFLQSSGNLKPTSINTYIRAVKAFYNFLIDDEVISDCSRKLKLIKQKREEIMPLSDSEIRLLLSCFGSSVLELRNKCLVLLMLDCGLRRSETIRLTVGDVDLVQKSLLVNGKGAKQRLVPIGKLTAECLEKYSRVYSVSDKRDSAFFKDRFGNPLDVNAVKQVFQDLKERTGIRRLHCHLLRHTFATLYLVDGGNLEMLRCIMGHSSISVTQIYLHLAGNYKLIREGLKSHVDFLQKNPPETP